MTHVIMQPWNFISFLVIQENGEWKLIGATSWAHSRCNVNRYPQGWENIQDSTFNEWMRVEAGLLYLDPYILQINDAFEI